MTLLNFLCLLCNNYLIFCVISVGRKVKNENVEYFGGCDEYKNRRFDQ